MTSWTVAEPQEIVVEEPVRHLKVTIVSGTVDVVATDGPPCVEVTQVGGVPLQLSLHDGVLRVGYEDHLGWERLLGWLRLPGTDRRSALSIAVPPSCDVELGVVSADAVVSGTTGTTTVRSASGDVVLDSLAGNIRAQSVSGDVECRAVRGELNFKTVSGNLTVVDGAPARVRGHSVSGDVLLDVAALTDQEIDLKTVSGDVTVRVPSDVDLQAQVRTVSGRCTSAFDELRVERQPGHAGLRGVLGTGTARLSAQTVSGDFAVFARATA